MPGFIAYPVISVFYYSLQNYNVTKPWRNGFAGLDNFTRIFTEDDQFWSTLGFSAQWNSAAVASSTTEPTGTRIPVRALPCCVRFPSLPTGCGRGAGVPAHPGSASARVCDPSEA